MSHELADEVYYMPTAGGQVPVRWTAPEVIRYIRKSSFTKHVKLQALLNRKYSSASDVWSFGMVLYEIWSLGKRPFHPLDNVQVVRAIKEQYCQAPPPGCPRAMYKLMVDCWYEF